MKPADFSKTDLKQLQRQLSDWRHKQTGRVRLPEAMWIAATKLARTHGTGLVASTLGLDYYKLRSRVKGKPVPLPGPPAFVEVKGADLPETSSAECRVELFDGTGAGMTLPVRGDLSTLLALVQSFWSHRR
jgi:hypothetical protein